MKENVNFDKLIDIEIIYVNLKYNN